MSATMLEEQGLSVVATRLGFEGINYSIENTGGGILVILVKPYGDDGMHYGVTCESQVDTGDEFLVVRYSRSEWEEMAEGEVVNENATLDEILRIGRHGESR